MFQYPLPLKSILPRTFLFRSIPVQTSLQRFILFIRIITKTHENILALNLFMPCGNIFEHLETFYCLPPKNNLWIEENSSP